MKCHACVRPVIFWRAVLHALSVDVKNTFKSDLTPPCELAAAAPPLVEGAARARRAADDRDDTGQHTRDAHTATANLGRADDPIVSGCRHAVLSAHRQRHSCHHIGGAARRHAWLCD